MSIANKLSILDFIVFFIIASIFSLVIYLAKFRQKSNVLEYLAMGRTLTLPAFVITLVSSWYGSTVGAVQIAYKYGIYNFFAMGFFWYLSALIFALFLASRFSKFKTFSLPEYIGNIYGPFAEKIVLTLLFLKTLPVAYVMALSIILSTLFGLATSTSLIITFAIALVISLRSSFKSVMIIDFIQFLTIFSGMGVTLYYCSTQLGSINFLQSSLPSSHFSITGGNDIQKLLLWFMVALSTTILSPIFHQRCFAAKTPNTAKLGIIISIIFWIISDILTTLSGLYARAYLGDGYNTNAYLLLIGEILPEGLVGYMIAVMLITAISALDSYLFATKSLVVNYYRGRNVILSKRAYFLLAFIIVTSSTAIASNMNGDIEKSWLLFESAFITSLLLPVLFSIYSKNLISSIQFNWIVTATFIVTLTTDYYYLSNGYSSSLIIIGLNALIIGLCAISKTLLKVKA